MDGKLTKTLAHLHSYDPKMKFASAKLSVDLKSKTIINKLTTNTDGIVTYSSSNTNVATVDKNGKVTLKGMGSCIITASASAGMNYAAKKVSYTLSVVPSTPSVTVKAESGKVLISWKKVTGASGYYVYRNGKKIATVKGGSKVSCKDSSVTNGTTYKYKVAAYSGSVKGTASAAKTICYLSTPSGLSVKNTAYRRLTVNWTKNTKATGTQIQFSTDSNFNSGAATVKVTRNTTTSAAITSLTKGKVYYVRVRYYKTSGGNTYYSAWKNAGKVTISR